jgi:hypothetical protein
MNEELLQRGYYSNGRLRGESYGKFEKFELAWIFHKQAC